MIKWTKGHRTDNSDRAYLNNKCDERASSITRGEMIAFVESQLKKIPGDRENAIRLLAFHMDEDDPENPELGFQQMVGGE